MANRRNCWEYLNCGREPGGAKEGEMGVCPAAVTPTFEGYNGGTNSGRACWLIAGTYCDGQVQGSFAQKFRDCFRCDFYQHVREEESEQPSALSLT